MNVVEIRDRILELSHDEAAPDTDLNRKSLRWLNSAYHELIDELRPFLRRYLQTEETVTTDENGQATLSSDVYRIIRVVDETHSRVLKERAYEDILDISPLTDAEGSAEYFWMQGSTLTLQPKGQATLKVVYLPEISDLLETDNESQILIPAQFHHALVWGGLVWSSVYERGFATQADLVLFQRKWDEAKQNVKLSLTARPSGSLRTAPFNFI